MNILRCPVTFDVNAIREEVFNNPNCWDFDTKQERTILPYSETRSIPLRSSKSRRGIKFEEIQETYDTILVPYFPATMSFINFFLSTYGGECGRVAIVKLPPDKMVYKHIDRGSYYATRDRFHLVIDGIYQYTVGDQTEIFQSGDLFWFDSQKMHHSKNISDVDRLILIFDVKGSKFREMSDTTFEPKASHLRQMEI